MIVYKDSVKPWEAALAGPLLASEAGTLLVSLVISSVVAVADAPNGNCNNARATSNS